MAPDLTEQVVIALVSTISVLLGVFISPFLSHFFMKRTDNRKARREGLEKAIKLLNEIPAWGEGQLHKAYQGLPVSKVNCPYLEAKSLILIYAPELDMYLRPLAETINTAYENLLKLAAFCASHETSGAPEAKLFFDQKFAESLSRNEEFLNLSRETTELLGSTFDQILSIVERIGDYIHR